MALRNCCILTFLVALVILPSPGVNAIINTVLERAKKSADGRIHEILHKVRQGLNMLDSGKAPESKTRCKTDYKTIVNDIVQALDLVKKGDFVSLGFKFFAVRGYITGCTQSLTPSGGGAKTTPFSKTNTTLSNLMNKVMEAISALTKKKL